MDLRQLQIQVKEDSERYFPKVKTAPIYLSNAIAGEAGEICNLVKKHYRSGETGYLDDVRCELPDILIYICMMANELGYDLMTEYELKRAHNDRKYARTV